MSNESPNGIQIQADPNTGYNSTQIKKGVKFLILAIVIGVLAIVIFVIAGKGQKSAASAQEEPSQTEQPSNIPSIGMNEVLSKAPEKGVVTASKPKIEINNSKPDDEFNVQIRKQWLAQQESKAKLLQDAMNSSIDIQYEEIKPQQISASPLHDTAAIQAEIARNQALLSQGSQPQESLDNTLVSQSTKEAFLNQSRKQDYLPSTREAPLSPYELTVGTLIPATSISAINSDVPGNIIAQISQNVYDSATGSTLLLPQGAKLYGIYDSRVAYGQERLPVSWSRINFPDGSKLNLGAMNGVDVTGMAGLSGDVNNHYWRLFGQATLLGGIAGINQAAVSDGDDNARSTGESIADGVTQQFAQTGSDLIRKNMNIQPTIEIDNGKQFYIIINQDVILPPYTPIN